MLGPPPENNWTNIIGALEEALEHAHEIDVINISLTNGEGEGFAPMFALNYFLRQFVDAGVVIVAAVGNSSRDLAGADGIYGTDDDYYPAAFPFVMSVSAMNPVTDRFWTDTPTVGSNFGELERTPANTYPDPQVQAIMATNYVNSPGGAIDVAAPGVNIITTSAGAGGTNYAIVPGTSAAAPHVTGLVALYIAAHGRATNAAGVFAIRQAIIDAALPQSQWRQQPTGDPDSHPEPLAMASEAWIPQPQIRQASGTPGNYQVQFDAVPGYDYSVQASTNLANPAAWTNLATQSASSNRLAISVTDTNGGAQRFYRLARKSQLEPVFPISGVIVTATSEVPALGRYATNVMDTFLAETNYWRSAGVADGYGEDPSPALTFDLGTARLLERALVWNAPGTNAAVKRLLVEVSTNGTNFTSLGESTLLPYPAVTQTIPLGRVSARYVRFTMLENASGQTFPIIGPPTATSFVGLREVEIDEYLGD
jgi:hypothetical protein